MCVVVVELDVLIEGGSLLYMRGCCCGREL